MALSETLPRLWFRRGLALRLLPLLPFSWLFAALSALRRGLYHTGLKRAERLPVPVIVVGNLIVGGAGKTPLTLSLVESLCAAGHRPGIVSRGYGVAVERPQLVSAADDAGRIGDEPLLLARRSGVPVAVCRDRVAAARALLAAHPECDVLVADDGLQHYRLERDVELAVFDARGAGNGHLLPAGPLREPLTRLQNVDALVWNGEPVAGVVESKVPQFCMTIAGARFAALNDGARQCDAAALRGRKLYALAGIGDPCRFFRQLEGLGLSFTPHPFPDHHAYVAQDLEFARDGVLLLTEKDAVKCAGLYSGEAWVLPVSAELESGLITRILEKINGCKAA